MEQFLVWRWEDGQTRIVPEGQYPVRTETRSIGELSIPCDVEMKIVASALVIAESPAEALAEFNRKNGYESAQLQLGFKVWVRSLSEFGIVRRFVGGQVEVDFGDGVGSLLLGWSDLVNAQSLEAITGNTPIRPASDRQTIG